MLIRWISFNNGLVVICISTSLSGFSDRITEHFEPHLHLFLPLTE